MASVTSHFLPLLAFSLIPQTSVALGVLADWVEDLGSVAAAKICDWEVASIASRRLLVDLFPRQASL